MVAINLLALATLFVLGWFCGVSVWYYPELACGTLLGSYVTFAFYGEWRIYDNGWCGVHAYCAWCLAAIMGGVVMYSHGTLLGMLSMLMFLFVSWPFGMFALTLAESWFPPAEWLDPPDRQTDQKD